MEQEILENVKLLLELSNGEEDDLIKFFISDTAAAVMRYCRIDVIPRQLYGIIAQMAAEAYRSFRKGGAVKSLTEGERRVEFSDGGAGSVFDSYAARLEPFVNRSARLPSETEVSRNDG